MLVFRQTKVCLKNEAKVQFPYYPVNLRIARDRVGLTHAYRVDFRGAITWPVFAPTIFRWRRCTAFCFTLIGVGPIAHLLKAALRWIPRVVASVVLAVACAKLVEIFGDLNFGIDPWFVRNPGLFGAVPTGRMAPMTAINFLLLEPACSLLLGSNRQNSPVLSVHSPLLSARLFLLAIGMRNAIALWRPHYPGRAFHCLRFFIGNRHRDGSRRDGMAVASISGRLHPRAVAAVLLCRSLPQRH